MAKKIKCSCCGTIRIINKTSGFTGVDFYKQMKKWRARVTDNNDKTYHLGYFDSELEASKIYDDFVIRNKLVDRPPNHTQRNRYDCK